MKKLDTSHFHALIMAGGKGERFWPWSRENKPKQLLQLLGRKTMIEMTVERLSPLVPRERVWIVTNPQQAKAMRKLMPRFPKSNYIIEPVGRDSAGAAMLGCASVTAKDPRAVMALLPSDALIQNVKSYQRVLRACFEAAQTDGNFVTIGISPTEASDAYGYIERGEKNRSLSRYGVSIFQARRFLEKPKIEIAKRLVKSKRFYWNAGMFIWSGETILEAFRKHSPIHARGWNAIQRNSKSYMRKGFLALPKISIDYAVMEKVKNVCVADGIFDWDDLGSWSAMYAHLPKDQEGNACRGKVVSLNSKNCIIQSAGKMIATLGVDNLVIVQTEDATLICNRDAAQRVKEIVRKLPSSLR